MTIGKQIRDARKAKKIRQHAVAEELGVTVQAVSQWERDKTIPGQLNLMRLANLLDIKIDGLEVLKQIPMFAKPAKYAPLIGKFPTLFYGPGKQDDDGEYDDIYSDFSEFAEDKTEMIPITWDPVGNVFAMRLDDRSMAPEFLPDDVIIVDSGISADPGDYVIGQKYPSKGGLFRRLRLVGSDAEGNAIADLVPINNDYPIETITIGKTGEITGCVREFRRILREK